MTASDGGAAAGYLADLETAAREADEARDTLARTMAGALRLTFLAAQAADRELEYAVRSARSAGWSWRQIGKAVRMTGEGARQRWSIPSERRPGER